MNEIMRIQEQFNQILSFSQNILEPKTDELFNMWYENKVKRFEHLFSNGNYIYEYPEEISLSPSEEILERDLNDFISDINYFFPRLSKFLKTFQDSFYTNTLPTTYNCDGINIQAGTKIVKAFKYFIENKQLLSAYQNRASQLIQKTKIHGTLCLSIHPLDYLSLSENNHNWRSCHSLDGSFRAGNLSYMADKSTIICYLKSEKKTNISHFPENVPWNSKKWRMLLFISDDQSMVLAGRQYPFNLNGVLSKVSTLLSYSQNFNLEECSNWDNTYLSQFTNELIGLTMDLRDKYLLGSKYGLVGLSTLMNEPQVPLHFNDLTESSCYLYPYYCYYGLDYFGRPNSWSKRKEEIFSIGQDIKCIHCGRHNIDRHTELMLCNECVNDLIEDSGWHCDCCGATIDSEIEPIEFRGLDICPECAQEKIKTCCICGSQEFIHQGVLQPGNEEFYCYDCLRQKESEE